MREVWDEVARWWVDAVRDDPSNSTDFLAVLAELLEGVDDDGLTLDVGCGEGQAMRSLTGPAIGTDISMPLLTAAAGAGPVVQARLPDLSWARSHAFDRAICVGVVEAIADHETLLRELRRVVRPEGRLLVVMNHPVTTAPHGEPLVDPNGEVFWRWGDYLRPGTIDQELGHDTVELCHRPLGDLLEAANEAGWRLERLIERGPSEATRLRYPDYYGQAQIPVLAGLAWRSETTPP